jgi:pyruvate ferredoxin oxidoreductase gamma subunit
MFNKKGLIEIRWHGRGGQGAVTSAELLAQAAIAENKYAQAFPSFGPERRGAPVQAFNRVDTQEPVRLRVDITTPDYVVVLDPGLLSKVKVTSGLKEGGVVIVNTRKTAEEIKKEFDITFPVATINATKIARENKIPTVNTTALGAVVKITGVIDKQSLIEPLKNRFGKLADVNIKAMETAFEQVAI